MTVMGGMVALGERGLDWRSLGAENDDDGDGISDAADLHIVSVRGPLLMLPSLLVTVKRKTQVPRPSITPVSGVHEMEVQVSMACSEPGSSIRFTLDGSDPRTGGTAAVGGVVQTYRSEPRSRVSLLLLLHELVERVPRTVSVPQWTGGSRVRRMGSDFPWSCTCFSVHCVPQRPLCDIYLRCSHPNL